MQIILLLFLFLLLSRSSTSIPRAGAPTTYPPGAYPPGVAPPASYYPPNGYYPGNSAAVAIGAVQTLGALASKFGSAVQPPQAPTSGYYNYGASAYTSGTPGPPPNSGGAYPPDFFGVNQGTGSSSFSAYAPGASTPGPFAPTSTAGAGDSLLPAYGDAATTPDTSLLVA